MGLADRYLSKQRPSNDTFGFGCPHYEPPDGSKRCRHYLDGGSCSRPDEFMCVEWLRANRHTIVEGDQIRAKPIKSDQTPKPILRDLFGNPVEEEPAAAPKPKSDPSPPTQQPPPAICDDTPLVPMLTEESIASFKELGIEVCLNVGQFGPVWLVPEYTGNEERLEMRTDHAATLAALCAAFPGAKLLSIKKSEK